MGYKQPWRTHQHKRPAHRGGMGMCSCKYPCLLHITWPTHIHKPEITTKHRSTRATFLPAHKLMCPHTPPTHTPPHKPATSRTSRGTAMKWPSMLATRQQPYHGARIMMLPCNSPTYLPTYLHFTWTGRWATGAHLHEPRHKTASGNMPCSIKRQHGVATSHLMCELLAKAATTAQTDVGISTTPTTLFRCCNSSSTCHCIWGILFTGRFDLRCHCVPHSAATAWPAKQKRPWSLLTQHNQERVCGPIPDNAVEALAHCHKAMLTHQHTMWYACQTQRHTLSDQPVTGSLSRVCAVWPLPQQAATRHTWQPAKLNAEPTCKYACTGSKRCP